MEAATVIKIAKTALEFKEARDNGPADANKNYIIALIATPLGIGLLLFGTLFISMALVMTWTASFSDPVTARAGSPTALAYKEVGKLLPYFQEAQTKYGVSWSVLAAIAKTESTFGTYPSGSVSSCGAVGIMQFLPTTWSGTTNPKAKDDPFWKPVSLPPSPNSSGLPYDTDPNSIARCGGYGIDADGDGYADPYNPKDAIFSAAAYLKANHADGQSWEDAIFAYNHDRSYVREIIDTAASYQMYQFPGVEGIWPTLPGFPITAVFRQVYSSTTGEALWTEGHQGIDIACPDGTPLYASTGGDVYFAGISSVYGNCIKIWNPFQQTMLVYGHLESFAVSTGQPVKQGQLIGYSGHSGRAFGAHLHFEVVVGGQLCDPLGWLKTESAPSEKINY